MNRFNTKYVCVLVSLVALLMIALQSTASAQFNVQHQPPTVLDPSAANTLEFFVPGITDNDVARALLFFRNENDFGYTQKEAQFNNGVFRVQLTPDEIAGNRLEYYFQVSLINSPNDLFFPENLPAENPVEVDLASQTETVSYPKLNAVDYTIMSPRPGKAIAANDLFIAIALFYDKQELEPGGSFRLLIDEKDVTASADTADYFISYVPEKLSRGAHTVRLLYKSPSGLSEVVSWQFSVVDPKKAQYTRLTPGLMPQGRVELTARNQLIAGEPNDALTGRTFLNGSYGLLRYSINGFLTSQESARLQPLNRYGINMQLGKWWKLEAGHVFPSMSQFTIQGRRMFGVNTSLHLLYENLNIQFMHGELSRKVTNLYNPIEADVVTVNGNPQDTLYTLGLQNNGQGTFARKITAVRVGLGNPKYVQLGIQAMKVEDDTSSVFNVIDFDDITSDNTSLLSNLTTDQRLQLINDPDQLQVQGGGLRPRGNFVAGADLRFGLDQNRIRFNTETVASVLNNDIYGGALDSLRAADIGFEDINQSDLDLLGQLSRLIIINENMSVVPIRLRNFNTDSASAEAFFPTSIIGSNTELSFNYPRNNLSIQYRWIGPDFISLANATIRRDIAGFTINDRIRLMQNQLFVTVGFESLFDNVANTRDATTTTNSYRTNLSWFPVRDVLPRVSAGFRYRTRSNGVGRFNPEVPNGLETASVLNLRIVDGDTLTTALPRANNTLNLNFSVTQQLRLWDMVHDASLTLSTLNTTDDVYAFGDATNHAVSFNLGTRFENIPLTTQLGLNVNNTQAGSGQLDIDIFGIFAGASYFLFDGKLNVNGRLAFTSNVTRNRQLQFVDQQYVDEQNAGVVSPSLDNNFLNDFYRLSDIETRRDFSTYVLIAGAEYRFNDQHSLIFDGNITNVSGVNTLNDRIIQLRYTYRF